MATSKRRVIKDKVSKGEETCWVWQEKCLDADLEGYEGFVYKITCIHPQYHNWVYIGKKSFLHKKTKRIGKRVIAATKTRKRVERTKVSSQWQNYWGSSRELLEVINTIGKEWFTREVLDFGINKSDLSLKEVEYMIAFNILRIKESWNNWCSCRIYKKHIIK